jgi:hypothetical protein
LEYAPKQNTSDNITITDEADENHTNNIIIFAVIEAIFLPFAITLYFALNHPEPLTKDEQEAEEDNQNPKTKKIES